MPTHVVENQPPILENYNVFKSDRALSDTLARQAPEILTDLSIAASSSHVYAARTESQNNLYIGPS